MWVLLRLEASSKANSNATGPGSILRRKWVCRPFSAARGSEIMVGDKFVASRLVAGHTFLRGVPPSLVLCFLLMPNAYA